MKPNILGISWLNGRLKATASHRNGRPAKWTCPYPVENANELAQALSASIRQTGFRGKEVSLVVHTTRLVHQLADTPPLEGALRERFLEKKALVLNPLGEAAAWSCQPAFTTGKGNTVLFHFLPKTFYETILQACRQSGLRCRHILSPVAVLQGQLLQLHPGTAETILLIAETEGSLTLLAGRGDGQVLFGRSLRHSEGADAGRFGQELSRCAAYAQQHFKTEKINRACWIGSVEGFERLKRFAMPPLFLPAPTGGPFSWAKEVIEISSLRLNKNVAFRIHTGSRRASIIRMRKLSVVPIVVLFVALFIGLKRRQQEAAPFDPVLFSLPSPAETVDPEPEQKRLVKNPFEADAPEIPWKLTAVWRQTGNRWAVLDGQLVTEAGRFGPGHIESIEETGVWLRTPLDRIWIGF